jgi:DNA primase
VGLIPQQFIDDLVARTDIVELINARVPLKKAGKNYQACCPFHNEKSPSFTVSPQKQFYHCFGCSANGTALGFLMEYDRLEFVDAVEELARMHGLDVPREGGPSRPQSTRLKSLHELMESVSAFYQQQLRTHTPAVDYLKQRGIDGSTAKAFGMGYAPNGWDALIKALASNKEVQQRLITTGMLIEKDGQQSGSRNAYDRFRDRIMFPIRDTRGRVIAFGGRVMGDEKPKYLNSPETPLYHKGKELYGLYEARQALRDIPRLLVVEGYMDVIALAQFGIPYAVATLGTALTEDHINPLFRATSEVVFCFDGDEAGRRAAAKAMDVCLGAMKDGRQVKFLFLPDGEDPDTLVRKQGQAEFEASAANAMPLSSFLIQTLCDGVQLNSIDGRARLVELARPWLAKIPVGVFRNLLAEELATRAQVKPIELLRNNPALAEAPQRQAKPVASAGRLTLTQRALAILLHDPSVAAGNAMPENIALSEDPGLQVLAELHTRAALKKPNSAQLLESMRANEGYFRRLNQLLMQTQNLHASGAEYAETLQRLDHEQQASALKATAADVVARSPSQMSEEAKTALREKLAAQAALRGLQNK